jgi:acetolactate synthase-1/2/3 large subunit
VLEELAEADVVLAVGTELGETDTLLFDGRPNLGGRLIRIDIDPGQLSSNALPDVAILSEAGSALEALERELGDFEADRARAEARVHTLGGRSQRLLDGRQRLHQRFVATVQEALPGVILVGDSTQPVYSANAFYRAERPRSYFNSSTGYGTLGYALPAALGARLARPERPVVALVGDGGLQFTVGELATAVELALPLPILLWNNRGYGEIKRYMAERGIPQIGVDIYTPDFPVIARGFGCRAERAESLKQLRGLLRLADQEPGPTLIEIDEEEARAW